MNAEMKWEKETERGVRWLRTLSRRTRSPPLASPTERERVRAEGGEARERTGLGFFLPGHLDLVM